MYQGYLQYYQSKKIITDTKKTLHTYHFIERENLRKYLCGLLYIVIDEADLEKRTNQFIDDIHNFHNKHIIQCYSETKPTLPEDPHYISSMTPTGFINGQYELRFYVNSLFQVLFFNIFFHS